MTSAIGMAKGMNDVERFDCNWKSDSDGWPVAYMEPFRAGEYVRHADYESLQQQLAAAREALERISVVEPYDALSYKANEIARAALATLQRDRQP